MSQMLTGIRVLDLTSAVVGPYATQLLGDAGADVIKVEDRKGDVMRWIAGRSPTPGMPGKFLHMNRNKRSISLDLKHRDGRDALLAIARTADVFLHNMRPAAIKRLGLTQQDIASVNPRAIYCNVVGFSQNGPYRDLPAYDSVLQGASGLSALMAERAGGEPAYVPFVVVDRMAATMVLSHIMMALFDRERTGTVRHLEIPMYESFVGLLLSEHLYGRTFDPPLSEPGDLRLLDPYAKPIRTKDGYVCVTTNTDKQVLALFDVIQRPDLKADRRFNNGPGRIENINAFFKLRAEAFAERESEHWVRELTKRDVPVMQLHSITSLLEDNYLYDVGLLQKIEHPTQGRIWSIGQAAKVSGQSLEIRHPSPHIGEHTREILSEAGFGQKQIDSFVKAGIAYCEDALTTARS